LTSMQTIVDEVLFMYSDKTRCVVFTNADRGDHREVTISGLSRRTTIQMQGPRA